MLTTSEAKAQSLDKGPIGGALLAVEEALTGAGTWNTAHQQVQRAVAGPVDAGTHTGLYHGAPAVLVLLEAASADGRPRYAAERDLLHRHVRHLVQQRLADAQTRLAGRRAAGFAEYDLFHGLTGLGALLLRTQPTSTELGDVLRYLIRLTEPYRLDGLTVPGWWVDHHPDQLAPTPGGHANLGIAHGAAGILAVLSMAVRTGYEIDGQFAAIGELTASFDRWRQEDQHGTWWPQWITRDDLAAGHTAQHEPGRPGWCYGTPGIARALQLAAIATREPTRQAAAETALADSLHDAALDLLTDGGLCHGLAGVYQTAYRAGEDATTLTVARRLPALAERLAATDPLTDDGLLTGDAGRQLALLTARTGTPPTSRWDTCLLIA
ncbi:lanthionine synthetase C family protein [Longispora sp. NPDC051575]|uniref:lanthionine synthetase C family protein n=1 Tax=Longispora sp. NPDC051575 TaxID=3154943 RepID=UPI00341A2568